MKRRMSNADELPYYACGTIRPAYSWRPDGPIQAARPLPAHRLLLWPRDGRIYSLGNLPAAHWPARLEPQHPFGALQAHRGAVPRAGHPHGRVDDKVGQFLSARLDVLPPEITDELADLQDEVPAEDFDAIRRLAEAELGAPLAQKYARFDETPLAAAEQAFAALTV